MNEKPYNPLDKANLGKSVKEALFERGVTNLPPGSSFEGAGIYAIYYIGPLDYYSRIAERNADDRWGLPNIRRESNTARIAEGYTAFRRTAR